MDRKVDSNKCELNMNSYDLIAIDMDNTLVAYNLKNSLELIHTLMQKHLIEEYKYAKDMIEQFCPKFCQKGLIVDKFRANILKLDANYRIICARHGFQELSEQQIQTVYGNSEDQFKRIPDVLSSGNQGTSKDFQFYVLRDYFSTPAAQILSKIVDLVDRSSTSSEVNYLNIWNSVYESIGFIYGNNGLKASFGAELVANPDKYFIKSSDRLKQWLKSLRKTGKHVVLITSSNVDSMKHLMNHCFGNEWITYFDICLTFARKPKFFTSDHKFLAIDSNDNIQSIVDSDQLKCGQIYSEGNWSELKAFVAKQSGTVDPKCVYIGDSFNDDCIVPNKYVDCETIIVVEELDEAVRPELDPSYWQSFAVDNKNNTTLWYRLIEKHSKLIVSKIDDLVDYSL